MRLAQLQKLEDVIDEALDTLKGARCREIVVWIRERYAEILVEHSNQLIEEELEARIRNRRKQRPLAEETKTSRNLCLDFGLPELQLDSEVSVPRDLNDLLYGKSDWKEADDATLREIDAHILLLEAQAAANLAKAGNWRRIRQAAARYANDNLDLTLGELRRVARGYPEWESGKTRTNTIPESPFLEENTFKEPICDITPYTK